MTATAAAEFAGPGTAAIRQPTLLSGLFRYVAATSWVHQLPLLALTVAVFLLEIVPLELQRRVQGSLKLGLNIYRAWVGECAKRHLRRRVCAWAREAQSATEAKGTAVSMVVAEVEPVGNFIGSAVSEPLLQAGILATVITYVFHIDRWMGAAAVALFLPQMVFVPLIQHAMNRRTRAGVWLLRQIGAGVIASNRVGAGADRGPDARIDRVFHVHMRIFELKFTMNFLMNLCTHRSSPRCCWTAGACSRPISRSAASWRSSPGSAG